MLCNFTLYTSSPLLFRNLKVDALRSMACRSHKGCTISFWSRQPDTATCHALSMVLISAPRMRISLKSGFISPLRYCALECFVGDLFFALLRLSRGFRIASPLRQFNNPPWSTPSVILISDPRHSSSNCINSTSCSMQQPARLAWWSRYLQGREEALASPLHLPYSQLETQITSSLIFISPSSTSACTASLNPPVCATQNKADRHSHCHHFDRGPNKLDLHCSQSSIWSQSLPRTQFACSYKRSVFAQNTWCRERRLPLPHCFAPDCLWKRNNISYLTSLGLGHIQSNAWCGQLHRRSPDRKSMRGTSASTLCDSLSLVVAIQYL